MDRFGSALFHAAPALAQYDILLKNAHVIDPKNGLDGTMDVAIQDGKVAAAAAGMDASKEVARADLRDSEGDRSHRQTEALKRVGARRGAGPNGA